MRACARAAGGTHLHASCFWGASVGRSGRPMGDTAPRSLCLGGELLIPLRGAAFRSSTVDQQLAPLGANTLYLNSLLNRLAYDLRLRHGHRPLAVRPTLARHNGPLSFRR